MLDDNEKPIKSGFVSIIGRTNVGKSTLLNQVVKQKISITSDKPQTTRNRIVGIYHTEDAQIIFVDTPGFHKPQFKLNEIMVDIARKSLEGVDAILYVVESEEKIGVGDRYILTELQKVKTPVLVAINKIDTVQKQQILPIIEAYRHAYNFQEIVPISALTGENILTLLNALINYLPSGPRYYPKDMITDQPEKVILAEFIREKILQQTEEEIPYSVMVTIENMEYSQEQPLYTILATIYVEKESQKAIIIGKEGRKLKQIGTRAREEMEAILGSQVYLKLWVKVKKNWRMDEKSLRSMIYR
jgi:GTP-binding protein Era